MARKIITVILCVVSLSAWSKSNLVSNATNASMDSTQLSGMNNPKSQEKSMSLWKVLRSNASTHMGMGLSPGYNNTAYLKISKRIGAPNLPFGAYQTIEYATENNLDYNTSSPLFRMPSGAYYHLNDKWTLLVGVDILSKALYNYTGIRKEIALCYQWKVVPVTVGYSFFMGPSIMIGLPVF